ncbi:MAG: hypothetical protein ACTHXO_00795 [Actinomycetaceae bacterium]
MDGPGRTVTASLVEELVQDSYDLVVERLPAGRRDALRRQDRGGGEES